MRNLKLLYQRVLKYDGISAKLMVHHPLEDVTFIYNEGIVKSINHKNNEIKELCIVDGVIAMEFIQINDCLCMATEAGEIIQFNFMNEEQEVVGLINDGIEEMCWSPDQELVVFVTKSYNVILMFSTFDPLVESSLDVKAAKEFITVGWGKKETQFHGSVGKNARTKEQIEIKDIDALDKTITCCWRGDGEYFAVNFVGSNGRMFKVYDKEGVLQYVSEICANLQVPISWKPSGLWIAKPEVHEKTNKYTITLFERNGLKHNELVLPFSFDDEKVTNLCWNQDSDILLIETLRGDVRALYFYTISNYHWDLKHYEEYSDSIIYTWSQNFAEPKQLHLISGDGTFSTLKFDFVINHSSGESSADESIVAVIDDKKLRLTNFKSQMVPPPMASLEVNLKERINFVEFLQKGGENFDTNSFMTVNFKNEIEVFRCIFGDAVNGRKLKEVEKFKEVKVDVKIMHLMWISETKILIASHSSIHLYNIDTNALENELVVEEIIGNVGRISDTSFFAHLIDGSTIIFDGELSILNDMKLPEFCEKIIAIDESFYALKTLKKKLYLNAKEIATEVTSIATTHDRAFLIFTTIGELKFINVKNPSEIVEIRRIERGSKIVTLVKDKAQIIFQLPRGNLETISPRILSLRIIKRHLDASNYRLAFDIMRKERINLNLLLDLNPQKFLNEMKNFVLQIDNIHWLNLFLTELKNEDVTVTMYKFCETSSATFDDGYKVEDKSRFICEKMLKIFEELDSKKYMLPSITCHVKNESFENALRLIWDLKSSKTADKEADDALKYLLYLIDINVMYNIALGMYDYQLVMYVAQKSQKDPKEYVPFLQELSKLDQSYAKFKIDCHLKRFSKAVAHIAPLCRDDEKKFEECVEIVRKHGLYDAAMEAFKDDEKCYKRVCNLFGDHLRVKGKLVEASLMYERGGDYQQALSSARNTLDWQRCLILARKCSFDESQMKELAEKLMDALADLNRHKESSEIARKFNFERKIFIETLINGKLYSEALLEVSLSGDENFIENLIKPRLVQHLSDAIQSIAEDKKNFIQQKGRLFQVREEKTRKSLLDEDHDDMLSDTTSIASQSSRLTSKTFKSSKAKRKYERKLTNLKEGNRFEDIALIDSIFKFIQKINGSEYQHAIKELIKNGVEMNFDEKCKELQKAFKDLLLTVKNSLDTIWIDEMATAGKYPETEEEMENYNLSQATSFDLIRPEQRFKPKLTVIDFEMEMFRENYVKRNF